MYYDSLPTPDSYIYSHDGLPEPSSYTYSRGGHSTSNSFASCDGLPEPDPYSYSSTAMMARASSNGSQASAENSYAVSPASSSPGLESPVEGITHGLNYFDLYGSSGGQQLLHYHHQQQVPPLNPNTLTNDHYPNNYSPPTAPPLGVQGPPGVPSDWWQAYDFIAEVENGQMPHWRLKEEFTPTADCPQVRPVQTVEAT